MPVHNIQLSWLRTFAAVGRLLSFSAAARQLNVTQSAMSQQIRLLEAKVGRKWITRYLPAGRERTQRLYVDSYAIAADMAEAGVGVCLLHDELVRGSRLRHVLVAPLEQRLPDEAGFFLLFRLAANR